MPLNENELAVEYRPRVLYFVLRKLRDHAAAEEIAQETVLITISALRNGKVQDESKIGSYLFGVASNLIRKHLRDKGRSEQSQQASNVGETVPWLNDPEAKVLLEERIQQVQQAISGLEDGDRDLLRHLFEDPVPLEQLAERLGISYIALRKRKSRLLERLRKSVESVPKRPRMTLIK